MASTPIINARFLAVDLEMTGVDPSVHEIVEVAAVPFTGFMIGDEEAFYSEIQPGRSVPSESKAIHGLKGSKLSTAPKLDEVLPEFLKLFYGRILVVHGSDTDLEFLSAKSRIVGIEPPRRPVIDTARLGSPLTSDDKSRPSLDELSAHFGLSRTKAKHNALYDAILTSKVFIKLIAKLKGEGTITTVFDLLKLGGV